MGQTTMVGFKLTSIKLKRRFDRIEKRGRSFFCVGVPASRILGEFPGSYFVDNLNLRNDYSFTTSYEYLWFVRL